MAKLDKQGLNTFIRELDKHINTKINRLDISPTAEKVMMADGQTVEEVVSANKTSILEHNELINQAIEKSEQAFQSGSNVKQNLVDKLTSEGLEVSTDNTFEELIGNIRIGSKWALVDGDQQYYSEVGFRSTKIPLSTLGFKPQHALFFHLGAYKCMGIYSPILTGSDTTYTGYYDNHAGQTGEAVFYNDAFYVQFFNGTGYKILLIGE